jgi:hypothetical protein
MINFTELCKTLLTEWELFAEASLEGLRVIATQARKFKREYSRALSNNSAEQKELALNNLIALQQQLRDQYGPNFSDEEFENLLKKSSFYIYSKGTDSPHNDSGGLIFLTPTYIKKLESL